MWGDDDPISFRRLHVLLLNLPIESETARILGAPKPGDWLVAEELLAGLYELLGDHRNNFIRANVPKSSHPNLPRVKVPRPGQDSDKDRKRSATGEELAQFVGKRGTVRYHPKAEESE